LTTIAVAGKGGTGKTTIAGLLIRYIKENKLGTVLAIDADPSANLNSVLGMELRCTVGDVREEMLANVGKGPALPGMAKIDFVDYKISESLEEGVGVDLLAMGRPEGPGCYCAANNMLRLCIDRLSESYDYVVIDNEAGLEHLSRRTTKSADILLVVSDPTSRGLAAAQRVVELVKELKTKVGRAYLVLNRVDGEMSPALAEAAGKVGVELIGTVPADPTVAEFDLAGKPTVELPADSPAYQAVVRIAGKLDLPKKS